MREMKFRAWVGQALKMFEVSDISWRDDKFFSFVEPDGGEWYEGANPILMQYTGLKDKNGKEIYEGDVVRKYTGKIIEIKWQELGDAGACYGYGFNQEGDCEVIGNVYENPELLK